MSIEDYYRQLESADNYNSDYLHSKLLVTLDELIKLTNDDVHKKELQEFCEEAKSFPLVVEKMDSDFREVKRIVWKVLEYLKDNLI